MQYFVAGIPDLVFRNFNVCLFPSLDDPTVQGLDKSRHLQTGEMIIIVVVLVMWAGRFVLCVVNIFLLNAENGQRALGNLYSQSACSIIPEQSIFW